MAYQVRVEQVTPRLIAAARGELIPGQVSSVMLRLLGHAWDFVKKSGIKTDGLNVAVYRNGWIEAGPGVFEKVEGCVTTPSGRAATVTHMGRYEALGDAHSAIVEWCEANGHEIEGTNWEIYGHHEDDPARRRTDVFYLLR